MKKLLLIVLPFLAIQNINADMIKDEAYVFYLKQRSKLINGFEANITSLNAARMLEDQLQIIINLYPSFVNNKVLLKSLIANIEKTNQAIIEAGNDLDQFVQKIKNL